MSKYKLKPGVSFVLLPGAGKVGPSDVLVGDQYQRFVPQFLVEVPDAAAPIPVAAKTPVPKEEAPVATTPVAVQDPKDVQSEQAKAPSVKGRSTKLKK